MSVHPIPRIHDNVSLAREVGHGTDVGLGGTRVNIDVIPVDLNVIAVIGIRAKDEVSER
jgi:hypothetical protein